MIKPNDSEVPYFFLVTEQYVLGTSEGIAASDRTIDVNFSDLANSYDLQTKLRLASSALIKPEWSPPLAYPLQGAELIEGVAGFLAAFTDDPVESRHKRDYLINNGLVRILFTDDGLRQQVEELYVPALRTFVSGLSLQ